jgi:hypothetical protein
MEFLGDIKRKEGEQERFANAVDKIDAYHNPELTGKIIVSLKKFFKHEMCPCLS